MQTRGGIPPGGISTLNLFIDNSLQTVQLKQAGQSLKEDLNDLPLGVGVSF